MNEKITKYNMDDSNDVTRFFSDITIFLKDQEHPENPHRKKVQYFMDAIAQLKAKENSAVNKCLLSFTLRTSQHSRGENEPRN